MLSAKYQILRGKNYLKGQGLAELRAIFLWGSFNNVPNKSMPSCVLTEGVIISRLSDDDRPCIWVRVSGCQLTSLPLPSPAPTRTDCLNSDMVHVISPPPHPTPTSDNVRIVRMQRAADIQLESLVCHVSFLRNLFTSIITRSFVIKLGVSSSLVG